MAIDLIKFIKGIVIRNDVDTTKQLQVEVSNSAVTATKTTLVAAQTANRTITLPDASTILVGEAITQTLTGKTINADLNTITNIDNADIKAGAAIDATKLGNGTVDNTELGRLDGILSSAVGISDTQALTNKTINADLNTISNIDNNDIKAGAAIDATKLGNGDVDNTELSRLNGVTSSVMGISDTQTLTNKTIDADLNTITNIENADIKAGAAIDATKIANGTVNNTEFQQLAAIGSAVVGVSDTQTLSNKTFSDPVTLAEIATPATPASGFGKVYFKSDGFLYQLNDDGSESKVGAGSGGINYILNPDAESNTTGWVLYEDTATSRPVNGIGVTTSNEITLTRTTSSPLRNNASFLLTKDAASRIGEGVSYDFTIARADQAKVLQISFDYEIASGTYSGGTSSTDSDIIAYIYDITNGQLIEPVPFKLDGAVVGTQYQYRGSFQSNSNSTSYRLMLHVATTSALAYALKFDNAIVGPQMSASSVSAITSDWISYTPTGNWTSNTFYSGKYRRVGDSMEVQVRVGISGGAPNATSFSVNIPTGYTIDTTKLVSAIAAENALGDATAADFGTGFHDGVVVLNSTTSVSVVGETVSIWTQAVPMTWASADIAYLNFQVPIVGWATSQTILGVSGSDGRVVAARMNGSGFASVANINTKATFSTTITDTHGALSSSTFTAPVSGFYDVAANLTFNAALWTATQRLILYVRINGADYEIARKTITTTASQIVEVSGALLGIKLDAGQTIEIRVLGELIVTAADGNFSISMHSGSSQIAPSESIMAQYLTDAGQSIPSGVTTVVNFEDKVYDSHNSVTVGATWKFTAPIAGTYQIYAYNAFAAASFSATGDAYNQISKNGSFHGFIYFKRTEAGTAFNRPQMNGQYTIKLLAGEYIDVRLNHNEATPRTLDTNPSLNRIEILRVGN